MPSLRDIKKRIVSVKSTQKITKAMKMVAAAKLRRAQQAVVGSRPYAKQLAAVVLDMLVQNESLNRSLLITGHSDVKKIELLIFTSNRGLCGGFNSNLLRRCLRFIQQKNVEGIECKVSVIGKKGRDFFNNRNVPILALESGLADSVSFETAGQLITSAVERFKSGQVGEFYLCYNTFKSAMTQEVSIEKLLPFATPMNTASAGASCIYEPSQARLLDVLMPKFLATQILRAHLESLASELGARMTAMDSATKNASEMIGALTLRYNRARQATITTELMDIVNGAESL